MGWWKIDSPIRGQIDWSHNTASRVVNAVPGAETGEDHYNGDGPADVMSDAMDIVLGIVGIPLPKPNSDDVVREVSKQEMLDLFLQRNPPQRFAVHATALLEVVDAAWTEIDVQYQDEWARPPCTEERTGICSFVFNPIFGE